MSDSDDDSGENFYSTRGRGEEEGEEQFHEVDNSLHADAAQDNAAEQLPPDDPHKAMPCRAHVRKGR